jgi:cystathionine beta-lyase
MDLQNFVERYAVDRKGTECLKWDALGQRFGDPELLPLWVADMEFRAPEVVVDAMRKRVDHGAFGYTLVPDSYFEAFDQWAADHGEARVKREWVRFSTGVVSSFYWMVNAFTAPGDAVLLATPVYYPMHDAVRNTGRTLVTTELVADESGDFRYDMAEMERLITENSVKLFIMCSPHNPVGRVWSEDELVAVLELCRSHGVLVVSDEIHQDIIVGSRKFIAAQQVADGKYVDNLVTLNAASKTFNLAGLVHSHIVIPDADLRARYDAWAKGIVLTETNIMGVTATEAAWRGGQDWLDGLLAVVRRNDAEFRRRLGQAAPKAAMPTLEGSYLLWVDLRDYVSPKDIKKFIQGSCHLAVDYGEWFSKKARGCVRFNLATTPAIVDEALDRLVAGLASL